MSRSNNIPFYVPYSCADLSSNKSLLRFYGRVVIRFSRKKMSNLFQLSRALFTSNTLFRKREPLKKLLKTLFFGKNSDIPFINSNIYYVVINEGDLNDTSFFG